MSEKLVQDQCKQYDPLQKFDISSILRSAIETYSTDNGLKEFSSEANSYVIPTELKVSNYFKMIEDSKLGVQISKAFDRDSKLNAINLSRDINEFLKDYPAHKETRYVILFNNHLLDAFPIIEGNPAKPLPKMKPDKNDLLSPIDPSNSAPPTPRRLLEIRTKSSKLGDADLTFNSTDHFKMDIPSVSPTSSNSAESLYYLRRASESASSIAPSSPSTEPIEISEDSLIIIPDLDESTPVSIKISYKYLVDIAERVKHSKESPEKLKKYELLVLGTTAWQALEDAGKILKQIHEFDGSSKADVAMKRKTEKEKNLEPGSLGPLVSAEEKWTNLYRKILTARDRLAYTTKDTDLITIFDGLAKQVKDTSITVADKKRNIANGLDSIKDHKIVLNIPVKYLKIITKLVERNNHVSKFP